MPKPVSSAAETSRSRAVREWSDQAVTRAVGAPLIPGNRVRILEDAAGNYPAWLEAIRSAERWVHFETYYMSDDAAGAQFAEALGEKAKEGVKVRLLYDWVGAFGHAPRRFWNRLEDAGVDVRCFNPPRLDSPFGWLSRDHRKMIAVDGRTGYVSGLCVGGSWVGDRERGIEPWRDTGIEVEGPALVDLEHAFADAWAAAGPPLTAREIPAEEIPPAGDVALRIVANIPNFGGTYRLDLLLAQLAREYMWIHDSYYMGTPPYVQALRTAAQAGVDVRLIVPGQNDVVLMHGLSRAGFRPLLDAGVRVFQWNGSMMHAKTAVVDGRWARIGSTNLNITSWLGNWEIDVMMENNRLAQAMEEQYVADLSRTTEIVLGGRQGRRRKLVAAGTGQRIRTGSASRMAAGVVRLGSSVTAAVTNHRELGPAEANLMALAAVLLIAFVLLAVFLPKVVIVPLAVLCSWVAIALLVQACRLRFKKQK